MSDAAFFEAYEGNVPGELFTRCAFLHVVLLQTLQAGS